MDVNYNNKGEMVSYNKSCKNDAFTLAEILITLGIIGIIASFVIPSLISNYRKSVIETSLKTFYSNINQAVTLSEVDNGPVLTWDQLSSGYVKDEDGNNITDKPLSLAYFEKYFKPYLKILKYEPLVLGSVGSVIVYFQDGSLMLFDGAAIKFFPRARDLKLINHPTVSGTLVYVKSDVGKKLFDFFFSPWGTQPSNKYHYNKKIEPYVGSWDGKDSTLYTKSDIGCNANPTNEAAYCTAVIQRNGWKIPNDYPFKF